MDQRMGLRIDAIGNFSNVIGEVNKFKAQLQGLKLPDKLTAKLEKGFDNVESKVSHFQSLLSKGITTKGDFSKLVSSARAADKALIDLKDDVKAIGDKDIQIAVINSAEIQKAERELNKIINAGEKLKNFGTSKGAGIISESEVAKIQKLANTSKGLKNKFQDVSNAFKTGDIDKANAAIESLIAHVRRYQTVMDSSKTTPGKGTAILKWANEVKTSLNGMVSDVERARASFNQLQSNKFDQMKNSINGITTGLGNATNGVRQFINAETEAASRVNQLNEQVGHLRTQANYFFGLQNMGRLIARGIREAAESVRDLDKAMTETAVVTDFSVGDMWNMLPEYTKLANELGATTQGAYETMTLYFQQGLDKQATFEIGEETMKMARIAGLDYAQTTNMMTAALRGFNMELNQTSAKRVNDVYSKLAAITASDTRELGLAMERTASIAHSAGMDFGNTTAFLAQMIETTREAPENLGTAMKTIIARFQELKENPYQISEVEGEEVDFNRVDKALKTIGVDLMDNKDKFRDLDDVFMDISERWNGLSQTQQRYIATIAAGARQQSRFLAMVQNYDRLKQLTEAAANSEGASDIQFGKTLESYEAKVNKLKNAWQAFTMSLANNNAIKFTIDRLKDIITFGNKIIQTFGKVGSVFGEVGKGIGEMVAAFGLGALGFKGLKGGANLGLKLLGGMTVKGASMGSGMFPGNMRNREVTGLASKITNPIVGAIDKLTAVVSGKQPIHGINGDDTFRSNLVKERRGNLYNKTREKTLGPINEKGKRKKSFTYFNAADIKKEFKDLSVVEQQQIYKSVPAIRSALQNGYTEAYKDLKLDKAGKSALQTHFKEIDNAVKAGQISPNDALKHLYNPASLASVLSESAPEVAKQLNQEINNQFKKLSFDDKKGLLREAKATADKKQLTGNERKQFIRQQMAMGVGETFGIDEKSTAQLGKVSGAMTTISSKAAMAGQSVMGLGMALDSIGLHGAGGALMTVGNGLIGIGMAAEGAVEGVKSLREGFEKLKGINPMLAAAGVIAAMGAVVVGGVIAYNKKMVENTQEAGQRVVDAFTKAKEKTTAQLDDIKKYNESWDLWSSGVDENGNNISLSTDEYQEYLKAVKSITSAHPELIKGYNAVGNAIIDNNTALKEAARLTKEDEAEALDTYLNSYDAIVAKQKTYKRWVNAIGGTGENNRKIGSSGNTKGSTGQAINPTTSKSMVDEANDVVESINKIEGGAEVLSQFGVEIDSTGKLTERGLETLRTHLGDINNAVKDLDLAPDEDGQKALDNMTEKVNTYAKTVQGLEKVSKDTYNWGWEYASKEGYDKLEGGLVVPFQTAIERLAEKGLGQKEFEGEIDRIGQKYQDLGGHLTDFQEIQRDVDAAQKELGETANFDAYTDSVEIATAQMDGWIAELKSSTDEADHILAEYLINQKEMMLDYSKSAEMDLSLGLNQDQALFKSSAEASKRYEAAKEELTDYASGINSAKAILDDALTDQNLEGRGSLAFEQASISILGEDFVKKNASNMGKIKSQMKEFQGWLQDGEGNALSMEETYTHFGDHIAKKLKESTGEIEGLGGPLSDFFTQTEEGIQINSKRLSELTDEQMAILAEKGLDMSVDWMSGMLNIGRQLGYYSSSNMDMIRQGLVEQKGEGTAVSEDGKTIYKKKSDFEEESRLANNSISETQEIEAKAKKAGIMLIDDITSMSGKSIKKMMDNLGVSAEKSGKDFGYNFVKEFEGMGGNKDEVSQAIDTALASDSFTDTEKESLKETQANLNTIWDNILENKSIGLEEDKGPEEETAKAATSIDSKLGQMLAEEGKLSKEAYGYNSKDKRAGLGFDALKSILGNEGRDTMAQFFAAGTDSAGKKLSNEEYTKQLDQLQRVRQHYAEQESLLRTNAKNTSGDEAKWWTAQADYYQRAIEYTDKYIEKGQEAHNKKLEQDKEENESNNQKTNNKTTNDKKEKDSTTEKQAEYQKYLDSIKAGENLKTPDEAKKEFGLSDKDLEDYKKKYTDAAAAAITTISGDLANPLKGVFDLLKIDNLPTDQLQAFTNTFSKVTEEAGLTDKEIAQLGLSLQNIPQDKLGSLTEQDFGVLISQLDLAEGRLQEIAQANPELKIQVDTEEGEQQAKTGAAKIVKDIGKQVGKIPIKYEPQPVSGTIGQAAQAIAGKVGKGVGGKVAEAANAVAKATPTQQNLAVTYKATITNPGEIKTTLQTKIKEILDSINKQNHSIKVKGTAQVTANTKTKTNKTVTTTKNVNTNKNTKVTTKTTGQGGVTALAAAIKGVSSKSVNIKANTKGTSAVESLKKAISGLRDKAVTLKTTKITETKSKATGQNNHIPRRSIPSFGSAARGRYGTVGPKNKGGLTLTGEEGFEIAWLPSENRSMILGADGPQMVNLPKNAVVWTNEQSKKIVKQKAIPANSMRAGGIPTSSSSVSTTTKRNTSNKPTKTITNTAKHVKNNSDKVAKAATNTAKSLGYVSVWWENIARKTEKSQRLMDDNAKAFEKYIKEMRATLHKTGESLKSGGGGGDDYIKSITKYIGYNQAQVNKATAELKQLDKGTAAQQKGKKGANKAAYNSGAASAVQISYSYKTGKKKKKSKTKNEIVNTAGYIVEQDGTYVINQAALNKVKNVEKRKALADALNKEINDRLSKKYSAEDNVKKAKEALEQMGEELYKTFFAWENELTKIWNLTKKITATENNISRAKEYQETLDKQITTGLAKSNNNSYLNQVMDTFILGLTESTDKLRTQIDLVNEQKDALRKILSIEDERTTLASITSKLESREALDEVSNEAATTLNNARSNLSSAQSRKTTAQNKINSLKKQKGKAKKKSKKNSIQAQINKEQKNLAKANSDIKKYQKQVSDATAAYNTAVMNAAANLSDTEKLGYEEYQKTLQDTIETQTAAQKYLTVTRNADGTVGVEFDTTSFENDKFEGLLNENRAKAIQDYVKQIVDSTSELSDAYKNANTSVNELYDELSQLQNDWADYADELWDISDNEIKRQTESFKQLSSSITDTLKRLLEDVKRKLDERRQQEDNANTERDIAQKQQRLAALRADTSGGHQTEIAQLEQEIAKAQQDYQRDLENQLLDKLQTQADLAAEQRERQIEIQETIAEGVNNASLVNLWMSDPATYRNEIYEAYKAANEYDKKPDALREQIDLKFEQLMTGLTTNQSKRAAVVKEIGEIQSIIEKIAKSLLLLTTNISNAKANGLSVVEARDLLGASYEDLRNKGNYDVSDFANSEIPYVDVRQAFSAEELKDNNVYGPEASKEIEEATKAAEQKQIEEEANNKIETGSTETKTKTNTNINTAADKQKKYNAYMNQLKAVKKIKPKNIKSSHINTLFSLGAAAGYGKASVLKHLLNKTGGSDPFTWENIFKAIIGASGIDRYNLVKTFGSNGSLPKALKTLGNPDTVSEIKKSKKYKSATALKFATGGLADYTGPAWLDGTPSKPELVLSATDTKNFLALKDVLSRVMNSTNSIDNSYDGDTNIEVNINVDHLNNDYDVDKVANRVKQIIVKDAGYRNVTQVRNLR